MPTRQEVAYFQMEIGRKPSQTLTYIHPDYSSPFKNHQTSREICFCKYLSTSKASGNQTWSASKHLSIHRKPPEVGATKTARNCCWGHLNHKIIKPNSISLPRRVQRELGSPINDWHPSSSIKSTYMIITAKQFTSFIYLKNQNYTDKWIS